MVKKYCTAQTLQTHKKLARIFEFPAIKLTYYKIPLNLLIFNFNANCLFFHFYNYLERNNFKFSLCRSANIAKQKLLERDEKLISASVTDCTRSKVPKNSDRFYHRVYNLRSQILLSFPFCQPNEQDQTLDLIRYEQSSTLCVKFISSRNFL